MPIGEGRSNITALVSRGDLALVLRRPPRTSTARGAHDVVREARFLTVLADSIVPVARLVALEEDEGILGAPFYLQEFLDGDVITQEVPEAYRGRVDQLGPRLVEALAALHSIPIDPRLGSTESGSAYVTRQLHTYRGLSNDAAMQSSELDELTHWLGGTIPTPQRVCLLHGDYRLGNVMFSSDPHPTVRAVLDWELASVGDPLVDVGWLLAAHAETGEDLDAITEMNRATQYPDFATRNDLQVLYADLTGLHTEHLDWYVVFALWRQYIGLRSFLLRASSETSPDPRLLSLSTGLPDLLARARCIAELDTSDAEPTARPTAHPREEN